jgi:hypothetical protein
MTEEKIESTARYRGITFLISSAGRFFVYLSGLFFVRESLTDTTQLIDDHQKAKSN